MATQFQTTPRSRWHLAGLAVLTIMLGLLTRSGLPMPALLATYGGDTLYATMIFFMVAWLWPHWPGWRIALVALGFCYVIEFSQLLTFGWLEALRQTLTGRLVLGAGFLGSDLICYAVGVGLGLAVDWGKRLRK
ncbi:MAG: DUF2809 domain-containing protein [Oscillochloridaceae bacterium umkhey_bin13]